jgi:hypothetical protein
MQGNNDLYWRCEAPARAIGARQEIIPEEHVEEIGRQPHDTPPLRWHVEVHWPDGTVSVARTARGYQRIRKHRRPGPVPGSVRANFPDIEGTAVFIRPDMARTRLHPQRG